MSENWPSATSLFAPTSLSRTSPREPPERDLSANGRARCRDDATWLSVHSRGVSLGARARCDRVERGVTRPSNPQALSVDYEDDVDVSVMDSYDGASCVVTDSQVVDRVTVGRVLRDQIATMVENN